MKSSRDIHIIGEVLAYPFRSVFVLFGLTEVTARSTLNY